MEFQTRSWPVFWTGIPAGSLWQYSAQRIVNMAPMGTATGDWSVCVQLLHSSWPVTSYKGTVSLVFNEMESTDVTAPVSRL